MTDSLSQEDRLSILRQRQVMSISEQVVSVYDVRNKPEYVNFEVGALSLEELHSLRVSLAKDGFHSVIDVENETCPVVVFSRRAHCIVKYFTDRNRKQEGLEWRRKYPWNQFLTTT